MLVNIFSITSSSFHNSARTINRLSSVCLGVLFIDICDEIVQIWLRLLDGLRIVIERETVHMKSCLAFAPAVNRCFNFLVPNALTKKTFPGLPLFVLQ